jgi:hypothetical protein
MIEKFEDSRERFTNYKEVNVWERLKFQDLMIQGTKDLSGLKVKSSEFGKKM